MRDKKIAIIGAGIGGLTLAISLLQNGFKNIKIYEKQKETNKQGSGISLGINSIKVLSKLGLSKEIIAAGKAIEIARLQDSNGEVLKEIDCNFFAKEFGLPSIALHRNKLHEALIKEVGSELIEFEQEFQSVNSNPDSSLEVSFESGKVIHADILVGADGLRSKVRNEIRSDIKLRYSGYTSWRGITEKKNIILENISSETWGYGARIGIVPINDQQLYWYATQNLAAQTKISNSKTHLLNLFKGWQHPIPSLIEQSPEESILPLDIYDFKPVQTWHKGNIVLIGDAIHATTPNLGQGASMAIESSYALAKELLNSDNTQQAFDNYQKARFKRTSFITNQSWDFGKLAQLENPLLCKLRNFLYKLSPNSMIINTLNKIYSYEA